MKLRVIATHRGWSFLMAGSYACGMEGPVGNKISWLAALRNLLFAFYPTNLEHCFEDPLTLII